MISFQKQVNDILNTIPPEKLRYQEEEVWMYEQIYNFVWNYACQHQLLNTALALPVVRALHDGTYRGTCTNRNGHICRRPYFCHSLSVCRMLINLHPPLSREEEDIVLASALCHDLKVHVPFPHQGDEIHTDYHLDPRIPEIMKLIYEGGCETEDDYRQVFERVRQNRLAILVRLADRGNIVEELYTVSIWKASEMIYETRHFYMPMCIYAREVYPELDTTIGVLQEKMRDLIEATDIFVSRYAAREKELSSQILLLQEENARMRALIRKKKEALWAEEHPEPSGE